MKTTFIFYRVYVIADKGHLDYYSFTHRTFSKDVDARRYSARLFNEGYSNVILKIITHADGEIQLEVLK